MMDKRECANAWKQVNIIYDETINEDNPGITMEKIISTLGMENTMEVFAAITELKKNDERISSRNRSIMNDIPVLPECTEWNSNNPIIYADTDHIHTTHFDDLLSELITKMEENEL